MVWTRKKIGTIAKTQSVPAVMTACVYDKPLTTSGRKQEFVKYRMMNLLGSPHWKRTTKKNEMEYDNARASVA